MADSPLTDSTGIVSLTLTSNGQAVADTVQIVSVEIEYCVNKIPSARIVILDGDMPNNDFPVSSQNVFKPGAVIELSCGYDNQETSLFKGIVIRHSIKIDGDNYSRLIVYCKDHAVAMTVGRKNANFVDAKDSDIMTQLINSYSNVSADVAVTKTQFKELVQYYCTDWDFLLTRAEVNGCLVTVDAGTISIRAPQVTGEAQLTVTYGIDLMAFDADLDAFAQYGTVKATAWDPSTQAVSEAQAGPVSLNSQGNIDSAELARVIGPDYFRLQTDIPLDNTALSDWVNGQQIKSGLARIRGSAAFQGSARAKIGTLIEIKGINDRFNGNVLVTQVRHRIVSGNWVSEIEFGLSEKWFTEQHAIEAPLASGFVPGIRGLQIGVVKKLDADPDGQYRIQVSIPVMQADAEGVWARLAGFYASGDVGAFFIPEVGDEVIIGYLNSDPAYPIILGSLYSSNRKPPYEITAENNTKAIVTRGKLKVEFDEEKKVITLITPNNNQIVINDDQKSLFLQDQNNNKVELSPGGITLDSPKDIKISAKGKVTIDAVDNVEVTSQADINGSGLNVNLQANVGLTAKGNATAELSASGQTTVKGAMVMIN
ncbi:Rhs element Vgr protein [Nitrosomonas sp. Nm51]|uniref:type VI secretion system tip protein VgrG n=1 Tax=Nitrosomonas sp. Nm51 TaxID=133720 RepID=UPI0008D59AE2|nr:type VI secretion system tip protein VgrG [Nitrosomonas sp. Nm51]SEQ95625.1 Rhs element Vgr protein [Nitrosomonas sp. Nm51]